MHVSNLIAIIAMILPVTALRPSAPRQKYTRRSADAITFPQRDFIGDLGARYQQLVKDHYVPMACLQAAILAGGADIATQTLEHAQALDYSHVAAMSTVASTMSGGANAVWLRMLEDQYPGRETDAIFKKTMIHAVILASIINSAYLAGVPALTDIYSTGLPITEGVEGWTLPEFVTLTKLEVCMFIPYNTLAFSFVPPRVRPLTHAMVSATFNVAVSAVTLGYWDAWVRGAAHVVHLN